MKIVIHCSASPQGRGDNAETIHKWHTDSPRDWSGIGYHEVILEDGTLQHGRPHYWQGAHCRKHNKNSIGICLIGMGGDATKEQLVILKSLLRDLMQKYPNSVILGHSDLDENKPNCPGFDVKKWVDDEL